MAIVEWGGIRNGIVALHQKARVGDCVINWNPLQLWQVTAADTLRLRLNFLAEREEKMRAWVEVLDVQNNVVATPFHIEQWFPVGVVQRIVDLPVNQQLIRFRIRAQMFQDFAYHQGRDTDNEVWYAEESRTFTAFVQFLGDFSLEYVPVTILYCPPEQDMTNALSQTKTYGTVATLGSSSLVGSGVTDTTSVRGGITMQSPYYSEGIDISSGEGSSASQSTENGSRNSIAFSYSWNTTLVADNQKAIGRAYWGPLGDLFVLLRNPFFTLVGDANGTSLHINGDRTQAETEILVVSANKLLRPGNDPVASRIPPDCRRRILELDPFIDNLDKFFPDQGGPLSEAANFFADPSVGPNSENRAARLAHYGISSGSILDLSAITEIAVEDINTNETVYEADVTNDFGVSTNVDVLGFFHESQDDTGQKVRRCKVTYQASKETQLRAVTTARCFLVRNQNAEEFTDLELWWDKHFSTFMFRYVPAQMIRLIGTVSDSSGVRLPNIRVELELRQDAEQSDQAGEERSDEADAQQSDNANERNERGRHFVTMTDHRGHFSIPGIRPGRYVVRSGDVEQKVTFQKRDLASKATKSISIKNVKRQINILKASTWELMDAFDIGAAAARRIQERTRAIQEKIEARALSNILAQEKIDTEAAAKRIAFRWPKK